MERISTHQFMILGAAVLLGGTFLPLATFVTGAGGRDGWMAVLPGFAVAIPYGLMVLSFLSQHPRENLLQISEKVFGKLIGKIIGFLYILVSCYYGGLMLAVIGIIFEQSIMLLTPRWVFYLGGLLLVLYMTENGIEVFARFSEVVFPIVAFVMILNIGLSIPRIEQGELFPILSEGLKPLYYSTLKVIPFPMEYILFLAGILAFLPTGKQVRGRLKTGVWRAVFFVGILDTLVVLIQILVFGPRETIRLAFGFLVLGKMVEISRTIAGVESIFLGIWLGVLVIKCCAFFFMTTWGIETVLNLKGLKWRLAVSAVFLGIALRTVNGYSLSREAAFIESYLILPFAAVWIPSLWGVSRWKKGAGVRRNA
ncbi:spore gernimation protein [Desulfosporosinus fructosivorans]|uniref:Spore gernimation protein n=1 Tax=Desulfosporosinus fructosivorans TaxID=2018669 RepID=A0A4Z0R1K7_9FIRM|nr:endospore germination permease [Desulfosporosinus fructosivorans]TGE36514.1 spore gernimation protein [Desulfosporosinus fructosivorans]